MTRVAAVGRRPKKRLTAVFDAVLEAEQAAVAAIEPGAACADIYHIANDVLKKHKMAKYFTHGLGHGVGIEIHELPRLNAQSRETLKPGMVVTVEPGVYLPGQGGVRIEDLILVTRNGHKVLSRAPRELRVLPFEE
jgi:Xaa-Pro aminopeptidase/Xaa-Pro dipeptidase